MKRKSKNKIIVLALALFLACPFSMIAQDSAKNELIVTLGYFMNNNNAIYLMAHAKTKTDKKFHPVKGIEINLYLDVDSAGNFLGKVTTDEGGEAKAILPPALKAVWDASATHKFIGISVANKEFDETKTETTITKSKIVIDTLSDGPARSIKVTVSALQKNEWVPVKGVEMKVGVVRSASILSAGDAETYTTDSTGTTTVEFKKDNLPGDQQGNFVLVAKVEDNDQLGNLEVEKTAPWGVVTKQDNNFFDQRTLWSTRFKTPLWLLFMAYSIVAAVWGSLLYLILQIFKIKKLGKPQA